MNEDWQRLNWLEEINAELPVTLERAVTGRWVIQINRRISIEGETLRQVIDAAMEATA